MTGVVEVVLAPVGQADDPVADPVHWTAVTIVASPVGVLGVAGLYVKLFVTVTVHWIVSPPEDPVLLHWSIVLGAAALETGASRASAATAGNAGLVLATAVASVVATWETTPEATGSEMTMAAGPGTAGWGAGAPVTAGMVPGSDPSAGVAAGVAGSSAGVAAGVVGSTGGVAAAVASRGGLAAAVASTGGLAAEVAGLVAGAPEVVCGTGAVPGADSDEVAGRVLGAGAVLDMVVEPSDASPSVPDEGCGSWARADDG